MTETTQERVDAIRLLESVAKSRTEPASVVQAAKDALDVYNQENRGAFLARAKATLGNAGSSEAAKLAAIDMIRRILYSGP